MRRSEKICQVKRVKLKEASVVGYQVESVVLVATCQIDYAPHEMVKKTAHFRVDPVFLELIMKKLSNVISAFLLLCVSIVAAAQSTPVSPIGDLATEDERAAKQYYSVRFTIRTKGEIFATPQATASSGQEVVMVSHSDTPYEFRFKLSDHTQFSAKPPLRRAIN